MTSITWTRISDNCLKSDHYTITKSAVRGVDVYLLFSLDRSKPDALGRFFDAESAKGMAEELERKEA